MSETRPAHAAPIVSVTLNTFFPTRLMTRYPYETLFSDAKMTPSVHTMPMVVAPGMNMYGACPCSCSLMFDDFSFFCWLVGIVDEAYY